MGKRMFRGLMFLGIVFVGLAIPPLPSVHAFISSARYDSGWESVEKGSEKVLIHNLGSDADDYLVFMQSRARYYGELNQKSYGGVDYGPNRSGTSFDNDRHGAYWSNLTENSITIHRRADDQSAEEIRVRIFVESDVNYDSGWVEVTTGTTTALWHGLDGNLDDYLVDTQFKNVEFGINQLYYGGCDFGEEEEGGTRENDRVGAYWSGLTNNYISITRRPEDDFAPQARVRVFIRPKSTFDSGWTALTSDYLNTITHNIGGNPEDYVVDMQFKNESHGVNQIAYGGMDFGSNPPVDLSENDMAGAYWSHLDNSSIKVWRFEHDIYAPEARIRVWNFWAPSSPEYDSKWKEIAQESSISLNHNIGENQADFLVELDSAQDNGVVNQTYQGGNDFGSAGFSGKRTNDRVGSYWYNLSNNNITVVRRTEDNYAANIRARIWKAPKPDYDSGWQLMTKGLSKDLTHDLGGDTDNYLVYMEFQNALTGVNNRMYGGMDVGASPPAGLNEDDRVGAYWSRLTNESIHIFRRQEDMTAVYVRIRIWRMATADYDSGWISLDPGEGAELPHNLKGNPNRYFINMIFDDENGLDAINQKYYGGMDWGANASGVYSENDRVGAYWTGLDNSSISIVRLNEDETADRIRLRIWRTPSTLTLEQIIDHILGRTLIPAIAREEADANGDGDINIADIIFMTQR